MRTQHISSKTINFDDVIGKKAILKINNSFENKKSLIIYADDKKIGISTAKNSLFNKGTKCSIEFLYLDNILLIETTIKSFEDGILFVSIPRSATIKQQRGHLRIACDIKCYIEQATTGKIKNLSAGGAFVNIDKPIDFNLLNKDSFKLCFTIKNNDLRLTCKIVESTDRYLRVKFIDLKDETKGLLTSYCRNIDAETYRRGKS